MAFLDELESGLNKTARTANGALSNKSSLDFVLDFFAQAGAMRGKADEAYTLFKKAYSQDSELAIKCLFYLRDIRGGQGERSVFRTIFDKIYSDDPVLARKIVSFIPEYGRWDEVLGILDGRETELKNLIRNQLDEDIANLETGKSISLLAKWLPSTNSSSKVSRVKGLKIAKMLGYKESQYRKVLSSLRTKIGLLEQEMSANNWSNIDYSKVPSQALRKHVKAFKRHDEERYEAFLGKVEKGEAKINTATLFTYEVYNMIKSGDAASANAMWNNLPDYTNGNNALVIADVSGSMTMGQYGAPTPMSVSVSLALYFAERNKGMFKGYFMTFSERPSLHKIVGDTLKDKIHNIESTDWSMSTNLEAAFAAILKAAVNGKASQDELPKTLYIISDMQFNACVGSSYGYRREETNFEAAKRKFEEAGYELPHVVFWNVNAQGDSPATKFDKNVTLISGSNQSTFQYAVAGKTPLESMMDILNSDRYAKITLK